MRTLTSACLCISVLYALTACTSTVVPSKLEPPAASLLVSPKKLPTLKSGDDLVAKHRELRRQYSTESGKLTRLQRYVKTVLAK